MYKPDLYQLHTSITNIDELKAKVSEDKLYYPKIHIAPECGLLNDPNGLAFFNNEYHIFYQYHPNRPAHGMKNWYHLTTKDFINYTSRGIILFPEQDYENYGIFSGNATVQGDYLRLNYTANYRDPENNYKREPKQCYALMNKEYQIIEKQVILDYDPHKYTEHYRDPYVTETGAMLIGAQNNQLTGVLSVVEDRHERTIEMTNELSGAYMLECPSYIEIDGHNILVLSPQGVNDDKYLNINSVVWVETALTPQISATPKLVDHGFDLYASQIFRDKNRVLMLSWLGHADTIYPHEVECGWSQTLTLMRSLSFKDDKLYQLPIDEYKQLRKSTYNLSSGLDLTRTYELECEMSEGGVLRIGDSDNYIAITLDQGVLSLDRSKMNDLVNAEYGNVRKIEALASTVTLRIYVDNSTLEVYINDGEYVMSSRIFLTNLAITKVQNVTGNYYELDSIKITPKGE